MGFAGQAVVDALILAAAGSLTAIGCLYVAMLWKMRNNFFILLRSPLLACTFGLCSSLRYMATVSEDVLVWDEDKDTVGDDGLLDLVGFPAVVAGLSAMVMTAVRLLVMYYPSKRARWGRYIKEKPLMWGLGFALVLMEIAVWLAALTQGVTRIANWIARIRPLTIAVMAIAASCLGCQLRSVHDSTNLSRDIGLVGRVMAGLFFVYGAVQFSPMSPLAYKYAHMVMLTTIHPPPVYIIIIRPVREVLRTVPRDSRSYFEALLAPHYRRTPIATVSDVEEHAAGQGRAVLVDSNRLSAIMGLPSLRAAFGEFCRKALCSESFEFLLEVERFKASAPSSEDGNDEVTEDFTRYLVIVNSFIKYGSHSEINIGFSTKHSIMDYITFDTYLLLDPERREGIFNRAEEEIGNLLTMNLLDKFLASAEYKAAVDLESG